MQYIDLFYSDYGVACQSVINMIKMEKIYDLSTRSIVSLSDILEIHSPAYISRHVKVLAVCSTLQLKIHENNSFIIIYYKHNTFIIMIIEYLQVTSSVLWRQTKHWVWETKLTQ